jgi:hypothetical protein
LEEKKDRMRAPGYKGEPLVLLDPADILQLHAEAAITADLLQKRLGFNVEVATTEWGTVIKRIYSKTRSHSAAGTYSSPLSFRWGQYRARAAFRSYLTGVVDAPITFLWNI